MLPKPGGDNGKIYVHGFVDADWDRDMDQRWSTNGYLFKMFSGEISWMSKRQVIVSLSAKEVEYMVAIHGSKDVVWLQRLCLGISFEQRAMKVSCNSQSTMFLENKLSYHSKTKHIDVKYHFVRDMVESKNFLLDKVDTLENIVDLLTKTVCVVKFSWCREAMRIVALVL
jgi:hypothetical protein